ncbi:S8 family serine peptidase [Methyloraptor flagellatus]|uniref:S8 family serine peptidase n=1 Tax=Methyloraptor flagellatus TaxID=3162530 RepID=A0AAU7XDE4_9HYPH
MCRRIPFGAGAVRVLSSVSLIAMASPASAQDASAWIDGEYLASKSLKQINAADAYQQGFTGKGVTIGILDTGVDGRSPEFQSETKFLGGFDARKNADGSYVVGPKGTYRFGFNGDTLLGKDENGQEQNGHGTQAAGIAVAPRDGKGIQGVAFDSGFYMAGPLSEIAAGWEWLIDKNVPIINNSFGNDCSKDTTKKTCDIRGFTAEQAAARLEGELPAIRNALAKDILMVFANGNSGRDDPDVHAALPYYQKQLQIDLLKNWIAVGAVDDKGVITDYSNRCGLAAQWCLVAPGEVYSTSIVGLGANGGAFGETGGTSFAAPAVAGVAALVKQAYPWFTAYDLQQTLLTTATDIGAPGVDPVYGWGLVNAGKAVRGYGQFVTTVMLDTKGYTSTFSNDINGAGGLIKTGAGTLIMTGRNTYAGQTSIEGGALQIDGSITSAVTVAQGGTLGGSGTVGPTLVIGTIGLGTPKTLTVGGELVFEPEGTYLASVKGAAADRINVMGPATLNGTLKLVALGGTYTFNTPYTLIAAAGGVNGTFATQQSTFGAGVNTGVSYNANAVLLTLRPKSLATVVASAPVPSKGSGSTSGGSTSGNTGGSTSGGSTSGGSGTTTPAATTSKPPSDVVAVAKALDRAVSDGTDTSRYFALYNLDADEIDEGLNQLTGEVHAGAIRLATQVSGQFLDAMTDPFASGRATEAFLAFGYAPTAPVSEGRQAIERAAAPASANYRIWGGPYGSTGRVAGNDATGASSVSVSSGGLVAGIDVRLAPNFIAGVALGGGRAWTSMGGSLGSASADVFQVGSFVTAQAGALTLTGAAGYSNLGISTRRSIPILDETGITARYTAHVFSGRVEGRYEVARIGGLGLSPFASFQAQDVMTPSYAEKDSAGVPFGVAVAARNNWTTRSVLGLDVRGSTTVGGMKLLGFARAGWGHFFAQGASYDARLVDVADSDFSVAGAVPVRDGLVVSTGFDLAFTSATTIAVRFDTEQAKNAQNYAGSARVKIAF